MKKNIKPVVSKPKRYRTIIKIQYAVTYCDSEIFGPTGMMDTMINTFECEGSIVQPLPKRFRLCMQMIAVPVRGKKTPTVLMITPDLMGAGRVFHRPYTKEEIKKMRADEDAREKKDEKEYRDYDD